MKKIGFWALYVLFLLLVADATFILFRTTQLYQMVKGKARSWEGRVHQYDPVKGFAPVPNANAQHVFPIGENQPVHFDRHGFRVPPGQETDLNRRPLILFLGCSYTYGDACTAEETFAYRVGQELQAGSINAGVASYGLAQMHLLAQELIPKYKPDYVVVQYSDWLIDRGITGFAPALYGKVPVPYFYPSADTFALAPPAFPTLIFDLPFDKFRHTEASATDFLKFAATVAVPLKVYDQFNLFLTHARRTLGLAPKCADDKKKVFDYFYENVAKTARRHNASLIVLGLEDLSFVPDNNLVYVNAEDALRANLTDSADYSRTYQHWRGDPPVLLDVHPNALAHRLIAEQVVKQIRAMESLTAEK